MPLPRIRRNLALDDVTTNKPCLNKIITGRIGDFLLVKPVFKQRMTLHVAMVFEAVDHPRTVHRRISAPPPFRALRVGRTNPIPQPPFPVLTDPSPNPVFLVT